jgi:hypothetical protein
MEARRAGAYRFTESARNIVFFSRYEASQWGSLTIEPYHLLALLREGNPAMHGYHHEQDVEPSCAWTQLVVLPLQTQSVCTCVRAIAPSFVAEQAAGCEGFSASLM